MKTFSDQRGREWKLRVNYLTLKRVREETGVNLGRLVGTSTLSDLAFDDLLLTQVVRSILDKQLKDANVSEEDFADDMRVEAIDEARDALLEELADFFPKPTAELLIAARRERSATIPYILKTFEATMQRLAKATQPTPSASV